MSFLSGILFGFALFGLVFVLLGAQTFNRLKKQGDHFFHCIECKSDFTVNTKLDTELDFCPFCDVDNDEEAN